MSLDQWSLPNLVEEGFNWYGMMTCTNWENGPNFLYEGWRGFDHGTRYQGMMDKYFQVIWWKRGRGIGRQKPCHYCIIEKCEVYEILKWMDSGKVIGSRNTY